MRRLIAAFITVSLACTAPLGGRDEEAAAPAATAQDTTPVIDHIAPKRDSVGAIPPRFEWTAIKGADQYVISLWNDVDILLWRQYLSETSVLWPKPLKVEEGTYFWAVSALRADQIVAESGRAAFVVLERAAPSPGH